jgi:hypothetical protein
MAEAARILGVEMGSGAIRGFIALCTDPGGEHALCWKSCASFTGRSNI